MSKTTKWTIGGICFVVGAAVYLWTAFQYTRPCSECEKKKASAAIEAEAPMPAIPAAPAAVK